LKKIIFLILLLPISGLAGYLVGINKPQPALKSIEDLVIPRPLETYQIENLKNANFSANLLEIGEEIQKTDKRTSNYFYLHFRPNPSSDKTKKTSGLINIPNIDGQLPLVVMIRGYVDQTIYKTGIGTQRAGEYFADNGFITIAPDFLGYASSEEESGNVFETRFQTYTTMLSLIDSLEQIEKWNKKDIFIWAHSNGGQIALTTLAVTNRPIPTTLWAPVTKSFPYSVLYYTDESADGGKFIRKELAQFEGLYDTDKFSFTNYLDSISAPIQIHQGTSDDAVPFVWSSSFSKIIKAKYINHPGADHDLKGAWQEAVDQDLEFFNSHIDKPIDN
jgi:cephalosporin-C deacetylase-like acetyl esterase